MRGREFIMKDAYSFDVDDDAANASYDAMFEAYQRIFQRCGLDFRPVEADTGAIGGSRSHEFQVLADSGEDAIVGCTQCDYAANVEQAELLDLGTADASKASEAYKPEHTPGDSSIEDVARKLGVDAQSVIKTLIFKLIDAEGVETVCAVLTRGDHHANEIKLKKLTGAVEVELYAGPGFDSNAPTDERGNLPPRGFAGLSVYQIFVE